MSNIKFEQIKLKAFRIITINGKKKQQQKTFMQTINPCNKVSNKNSLRYGLIKNRNDILIELKEEVKKWQNES